MNKKKRVHYLQHVDFEGLGYIQTWLQENDFELTATRFFEGPVQFPDPGQITALIIMGGPMSIYDEPLYPWLSLEKEFIKNCLSAGVKILGICLGAQLLADALGARVRKAGHREIGWFPVMPTRPSLKTEPVIAGPALEKDWSRAVASIFKGHPTVFHWHADQFEIPEGGIHLLDSEANSHQAFCLQDKIIGLQFHLEVTPESLELMAENGQDELKTLGPYIQGSELLLGGGRHIANCNQRMKQLLELWTVD